MNYLPTWPHQPKEYATIRLLALWVLLDGSEQAVSKSPRIGEDSVQAEGGQPTGRPPAPAICLPYSIDGNHRVGALNELRILLKKELNDCARPQETRRVAEILELMEWDTEARTWWQKAADKGDEDAQDYLEVLDAEQKNELLTCQEEQGKGYFVGTVTSLMGDSDFACSRKAAGRVESALAEAGLDLPDGKAQALIREIEDFLGRLDPTTGGPRC
ncbi:hypothetical protein LXH13_39590 [Streptomyces spinosirectus]|jgi:hypothetical protein|uniref:hypothetical protein n=1 Tax=Streptomyces TaxID=1883 RepID=UPI001C9D9D74|nr:MULTISPECIES: hypothetical protein [Streptomyces]MBY8345798.1 hypothetical protein [Streptomyces plumbidurans]UIR22763.1 hypothetical protein LXH13_39590 [Streptomyces spinosirectus]